MIDASHITRIKLRVKIPGLDVTCRWYVHPTLDHAPLEVRP